jgi:hypothetical protein
MKETKKLYLTTWEYNAHLLLTEIERLVKAEGGELVATWQIHPRECYEITNRRLLEEIEKNKRIKERNELFDRECPAETLERLEYLKQFDTKPRKSFYYWLYINFELNGVYYSLSFNENPFYAFYYSKQIIDNKRIFTDCHQNVLPRTWEATAPCYSFNTDEKIRLAALEILNILKKGEFANTKFCKMKKKLIKIIDEEEAEK